MDERLLRLYLDDRTAVLYAAGELVRRMLRQTKDGEIRVFLEEALPVVEDDRRAAEAVLRRHGGSPSRAKRGALWLAEKAGRLRGNGNLRGYSPLTRVVELDGLRTMLETDRGVWRALERLGEDGAAARAERVEVLLARTDALRLEAAEVALGGGTRRL